MATIEVRTKYLFPDALSTGKVYTAIFGGNMVLIQKGKSVPYVILYLDLGEGLTEYELCVWNIQSKTIKDTENIKGQGNVTIERKGKYIYMEVA